MLLPAPLAFLSLIVSAAGLLAADPALSEANANDATVSLPDLTNSQTPLPRAPETPPVMPNFQAGAARWYPPETPPEKWEWVELNTGEWLKGTIDGIRNDRMEFDSDKFDNVNLKMRDVIQSRSSRINTFVFTEQRVVIGVGQITAKEIVVESEGEERRFPREQLISLVVGNRNELRLWSGKVGIGVSSSSGNTNQMTANLQASLKRRGAFLRLEANYYGNFGQSNGETNVDNQQLMFQADLFIRDRFFLIPTIFEYYSDEFANIGLRVKPGAGIGYQITRRSELEWEITTVGLYQHVDFFSSPPGQERSFDSFAVSVATSTRWDITRDITLDSAYSLTVPTSRSSHLDQQAIVKLEIDVTKYLTLNSTLNWTRIGDPMEQADGEIPDKDDLVLSFGMELNF